MGIPETIYNYARNKGFTKEAACALLANIQGESVFRSDNAEDRVHSSGISDREYTSRADLGLTTFAGKDFIHDSVGYGYAQWTYWSRKQKLLAYAKSKGCSVSDSAMQIEFLFIEMQSDFSTQWNLCRTSHDLKYILRNLIDVWENPYDHQGAYNARLPMANYWYEKLPDVVSTNEAPAEEQDVDDEGVKIDKTWPPRTIDRSCSGWKEVKLLEALLYCRGYNVLIDGIFEESLYEKLIKFQTAEGLQPDGCCGPLTWKKLFELPAGF